MIFDYLHDHGDRTFTVEPLNEVDLLVFAGISYFNFAEDLFGDSLPTALEQAVVPFGKTYDVKERLFDQEKKEDQLLRNAVINASRYTPVRMLDFVNNFEQGNHQFAALSMQIDDVLLVVYRGTDESITGWNEALQLSLEEPLPVQLLAQQFLKKQSAVTSGPIIVCGHSKGGNLAGYAAAMCAADRALASRIASVVSFDGPGLPWRVRQTRGYAAIVPAISVYIPKSSIIGNIHEHPYGTVEYIEARGAFMEQHDIFNWETEGTHFVPCKQAPDGKVGSAALNLLVDNLNDQQKNRIFDVLFFGPRLKRRFI